MMLKKIIYDVSIVTHWMENPYLQDFTSEKAFQDLTWNMLNLISGVSKTEGGTTTQLATYNWYADDEDVLEAIFFDRSLEFLQRGAAVR
jgi:hypothetical protein